MELFEIVMFSRYLKKCIEWFLNILLINIYDNHLEGFGGVLDYFVDVLHGSGQGKTSGSVVTGDVQVVELIAEVFA